MNSVLTPIDPGRVVFVETIGLSEERNGPLRVTHGNWFPSENLAPELPPDFEVRLVRYEIHGIRVFCLVDHSNDGTLPAALAGEAILCAQGRMTAAQRNTYQAMRFLLQWDPREKLALQSLKSSMDLMVRSRATVASLGYSDVLPEDFGVMGTDSKRWSVAKLIEEGRRTAAGTGIENPTPHQCIVHGIAEEARLHPVDTASITAEEIRSRLRLAFFDTGPATIAIDEETKTRVYDRWTRAIQKRKEPTNTEFMSWFETRDNIYHQLAKQAKADGGPMDRSVVRQALIELAYDSLDYTASAVDTFMRTVQQCIDPPLTAAEEALFRSVNCSIPELGYLPLALIHARWPDLAAVTRRIFENPSDKGLWGQTLRMIETFATISARRRHVESEKKRSPRRPQTLIEGSEANADHTNETARDVLCCLLERKDVCCKCKSFAHWGVLLFQPKSNLLTARCGECGQSFSTKVSRSDRTEIENLFRK